MKIKILTPDEYSWARILVNDKWMVICSYTLFGSTRVCLHQPDSISLLCNWCAGNRPADIIYLINTVLGYLEAGDEDIMPFCSNTKPYYQDERFTATIKAYHKTYIKIN